MDNGNHDEQRGFYWGKNEGWRDLPKGYVRALLSVSARHSLTSARAWIIPRIDKHKQQEGIN